jgi:hypothetical protein
VVPVVHGRVTDTMSLLHAVEVDEISVKYTRLVDVFAIAHPTDKFCPVILHATTRLSCSYKFLDEHYPRNFFAKFHTSLSLDPFMNNSDRRITE